MKEMVVFLNLCDLDFVDMVFMLFVVFALTRFEIISTIKIIGKYIVAISVFVNTLQLLGVLK